MEAKVMALVGKNMTVQVQPFSREWIVSFKDPIQLWNENWFALALEILTPIILFQLFRNARKTSPTTAYIILASVFTATFFEVLPIIPRPGYQLWWYHQGMINVLKNRVPSYVISIHALVFYIAHCLTSKCNLPTWTRSVVTGITATLIMFPCLWLAQHLLLLILHFDDPVFKDKVVGVSYIQLVVSLLMFFHTSHLYQQNVAEIEPQERNTLSYIKCCVQSGLVSGIYSIVEQYLLYIFLNLTIGGHTVICLLVAVSILLYMARDEIREMQMTSYSVHGIISPLLRKELWMAIAAMMFISTLPLWLNTQNLRSTSTRLELGPCHINHNVSNTSPLEIQRRRYLCPDDVTSLNFDFHCASPYETMQGVKNNSKHYTICGKEFKDPYQTTKHLLIYSAGCIALFYTILLHSFSFKIQEKIIEDISKKVE